MRAGALTVWALGLGLLLAAGCGGSQKVPTGPESRGKEFRGLASYYGKRFHGRKTANGERYDMYKLTAASRTLAFGTVVRVINLKNRKAVIVRINDRGPFGDRRRVLDLSYGAAQRLGMIRDGVVPVRVQILSVPPPKKRR